MSDKFETVIGKRGERFIIQLPAKTNYYCVMCGERDCWFEDFVDDYYTGRFIDCHSCKHSQWGITDLNLKDSPEGLE
jgi:hypothetical protein